MNSYSFDKRSCFDRARNLLDKDDDLLLRYVCLELRFCIEAIVYDKLRFYAKRLPASVIETWQPPQAMKALLKIEPDANQTFSLYISERPEPHDGRFLHMGTQQALPISFINKIYNKLGSYLHAPSLKAQELRPQSAAPNKLRTDLEAIMTQLQPVIKSSFDATFAQVVTFVCVECKSLTPCNADGLRQTHKAECININCGAQFAALETDDGEFSFNLSFQLFECMKCHHSNQIGTHKLRVGAEFSCDSCKARFQLVQPIWAYTPLEVSERQNPSPVDDAA